MIRWASTVFFVLLGSPSLAQDIVVRTGDHPSFTRIVFSPPAGTDWDLARVTEGYQLSVSEPANLNTILFFERIQRDRIAAIRPGQSNSQLIIELACDCFAEAFQWRQDQVVIDIKEPGSPTSSDSLPIADLRTNGREGPANPSAVREPQLDQGTPILIDLPPPPVPELTQPIQPPLALPLIVTENQAPPDRQSAIDPLNQLLVQQTRVGSLEGAIADSLGRALSQGLLDPGENEPAALQNKGLEPDLAELLENVEAALTPGLIARTSVDREDVSTALQSQVNNEITCIPASLVDIPSWHSDIPFATLIGDLRTKITGEFDRTDTAAIEELARAYLAFGFGREAINTLSIDGADSRSRRVLKTLAEIIDADPVTTDDFHLQSGCPGPIALWGFLAHREGPMPGQIDVNGIVVSFKLLPKNLREHLAPRLAQKLNALGHQDLADDVLSIGDDTKIDVTTTKLEILTDRGATERVASQLTELVEDNPRIPPEALIQLINLDLAAEKPITADRLTLLQTFQFETQDDKLRGKLYETEIRVMIAMKAHEAAQDLINTHEDILTSAVADALRASIQSEIATSSSDADFLKVAFDSSQDISNPNIQNAFATRLLALGFPDRAQTFIKENVIGDYMMERRYLRAQAAVALGNLTQAEAHLAGMTTQRAEQILEDYRDTTTTALASVNPQDIDPENDPLLLNVAERIEETTIFQSDTETPLTDSRALADEAATLRQDLTALIQRYEIRQ